MLIKNSKKIEFLSLFLTIFVFLIFSGNCFAESYPDGCASWDTYCVVDDVTADLTWNSFTQAEVNDLNSGCTLQSVTYTVEIIDVNQVDVGSATNYSWAGLSSETSYTWRVKVNYQCSVYYMSGSVYTETYPFTTASCNHAPYTSDMTISTWSAGCNYNMAVPTFVWEYHDDDDDDPQTVYQIRIDNDAVFGVDGNDDPVLDGDEFTCNGVVCTGGSFSSFTPNPPESNWVASSIHNTTYYWSVRVKDSNNNWSSWSDSEVTTLFISKIHTYPEPSFTHTPESPAEDEEVIFTDSSTCYDSLNQPYMCNVNGSNSYLWNFGDGETSDSNATSVAHTYSEVSDLGYTVTLQVTDDQGTCSTYGDTPININLPLPEYKEVPAVGWLQKIFSIIIEFLKV